VSSLSAFLIDRASKNIELANYLFWYLRVELENRTYESRYREVCCVCLCCLMIVDISVSQELLPHTHTHLPLPHNYYFRSLLHSRNDYLKPLLVTMEQSSLLVDINRHHPNRRHQLVLHYGTFSHVRRALYLGYYVVNLKVKVFVVKKM
jgi:hypothetical protein